MNHMQFLMNRAAAPQGEPCGHALMATYPPDDEEYEIIPDMPEGHGIQNLPLWKKPPDLSGTNLANLLELSTRLNLDGEITPVMAWGMVLGHPRFSELRSEDFMAVTKNLKDKVRCYG